MPSPQSPERVLDRMFTESPELHTGTFSRSSRTSSGSSTLLDEVNFARDTIVDEPPGRPIRFRSASLALDAATASFSKYKGKGQKRKEDRILEINTEMGYIATMASPLTSGLEGSAMQVLQSGVNSAVEGLPELLKVLQDVAAIHPFIQLAVGAFKVAIELDLKRRENDKKITLLFLEMRDMMSALTELQNVQDGPTHIGKDGKTIQERLQYLVDLMEEDIKECANACDAYAKKKLLSKVFQGSRWDDALQVFAKRFTKRRADIEFALAIHLGINIDIAHRKLDTLDSKMDLIIDFFRQNVTPEQRDLAAQIQRRGGVEAVLANEMLLADLCKEKPGLSTPTSRSFEKIRRRESTTDFHALKAELLDDPDIAIANNMETFERKFRMQQRELADEMRRIVYHQGDLVINAVTAGPHDRIIDPDLRNIWKEMRWRGNVKARYFVLALRDYCLEKLDKLKKHEKTFGDCEYKSRVTEQDEWTLEYINVTRLQAIIEAFDDDASGFITVGEANAFTTARPAGWSLLHWMAYWAVGWQMAMTHYIVQIDQLLEKMFAIKSLVLPANRRFVERYLDVVWTLITELTTGFRRADWNDSMREKFQEYVAAEEERMRGRLDVIRYDIDAADTLILVTGPGRIEKHLFLILYLLLKRDFKVMRLAQTTVLHKDELWDSANTIEWVFRAVNDRHHDLENLFKQQNYDPTQQFKVFAFELFNYWHDPTPLWSFDRLRETRFVDATYNDAEEDPCAAPADVLNHPVEDTDDPLVTTELIESIDDLNAQGPLHAILGHWCGFLGQEDMYPCEPMMSLELHAATSKAGQFIASGVAPTGTRWKLVGDFKQDRDGRIVYSFTVTFAARFWPRRFRGILSEDGRIFSGSWNSTSHSEGGNFFFKRLTCDAMRFWPTPVSMEKSQPRALWQFALRAVQDQVRRQLFSTSRMKERTEVRQRYLQVVRSEGTNRLENDDDRDAMQRCYLSMTPSEARYFRMVYEYRLRLAPKHFGVTCSQCRTTVTGARIICLDCHTPRSTIDLCEKPECLAATIGPDRRADLPTSHLPTHRLLKVRRVVHRHRELGGVYRAAQDALIRAEDALADASTIHSSQASGDDSPEGRVADMRAERIVSRELSCVGCRTRVSRPCWYCIECEDEAFICSSCEARNVSVKGKHKAAHGVVFCPAAREESKSEVGQATWLDKRMDSLETKFDSTHHMSGIRLDSLERKIDALTAQVAGQLGQTDDRHGSSRERLDILDGRMQNIESMIAVLLTKLGEKL